MTIQQPDHERELRFSKGKKLNDYCWQIVKRMVEMHNISEHEALLRVADFCIKAKVAGPRDEDYNIIMHRSYDYWAEGIYFQ